ncbi:MAG: hypothetical protein QOC56_763 [Alphaproteobacteria bacterium]|nr:hypothetical protein [Alphaproteobacteria bacterium]
MINLPTLAGFEGLIDLDRQGVDIKPTLLRVLTDQYLLSPAHTPDEERHYTELAMRLIDESEIATRASIATRLAEHPAAPRAIVQQLARDVLEVAEPILRHSPCLTPADLEAIAAERGPSYAAIIAQRGQPRVLSVPVPALAPTSARIASRAAEVSLRALESPETATVAAPDRTIPALRDERTEAGGGSDATELCELFFAAGAPERRLILMNLDYATSTPREPPAPMQRADIWRLESSALQHNTEAVVRELERALGVSLRLARRIVGDELGEPIVVAAKAMQLPADVVQRMVLFMNPRVGQSVDRVYELADLYSEIGVDAARRMIAIWRDAGAAEEHSGRHDAQWQEAVESARRALSEISVRAPARQRDTLLLEPHARVGGPGKQRA